MTVGKFLIAALFALCASPAFAQSSLSTTTCPGTGCMVVQTTQTGVIGVQVTGTFVGTLQVTGTVDKVNFGNALPISPFGSRTVQFSITAPGLYMMNVSGLNQIKVAFTAYTSGTANVSASPNGSFSGDPTNQIGNAWTLMSTPGANIAVTATQAAAPGLVHVLDCLAVTLSSNTTAPAAVVVTLSVSDGATAKFSATMSLPATAGVFSPIPVCGLNIRGTAGTAMTIAFNAAAGPNTFESVFASGHDEIP
jgi:hypothetical protein